MQNVGLMNIILKVLGADIRKMNMVSLDFVVVGVPVKINRRKVP